MQPINSLRYSQLVAYLALMGTSFQQFGSQFSYVMHNLPTKNRRGLVDPYQLINVAIIVLIGYIAIILLSNIQTIAPCTDITNTTLSAACSSFFNNSSVLFTLFGVLLLLLVIPMIRGVLGGKGGK